MYKDTVSWEWRADFWGSEELRKTRAQRVGSKRERFKRSTRGGGGGRFLCYTWTWVHNKHESSLGTLSQQQGHGVQFLGSIAVPNRPFAEGSTQ